MQSVRRKFDKTIKASKRCKLHMIILTEKKIKQHKVNSHSDLNKDSTRCEHIYQNN